MAYETGSILYTADKVMSEVDETKGVQVIFEKIELKPKKLEIEKFFDSSTMSVHIRENCTVKAKKGKPGKWSFVEVSKKSLERKEIRDIAIEIVEEANRRQDGFVEIDRPGSTIVQIANFRIVITKPPFSDGWEITVVRPVAKLKFTDYKLSDNLKKRISEQAEGILIAGAPGMGKSTFAQALAESFASQDKIVKTVEAPRDLNLPEDITQYAISHGTSQEVHDILLLSRPDYTIFDEMRNTEDFRLFSDLRLAGVGMLGVVHGTAPIDAIQRFIGRIELGVIPQVVDTVVFIKNG
ncbi:Flp pilus assembly complex ATPase component TadA, partial [Candidatus Woesearchaeota archaeon]|nr:Flp pilus assembly complex ATPase component TadA [Candidatus Woesearchaeota archaeon]